MPDKIVLLTGVFQGLGLFLCKELTKKGFRVIGIDRPDKEELSGELNRMLLYYYSFDLSNTAEIPELINKIVAENRRIDILINNAGIKSFKLLSDYSDDDFQKIIDVNFLAPVLFAKHLIPVMSQQNYGRIINIASNAGFEGYKTGTAYCSSKGALHLFTQAIAPELTNGVTINTVSPATISTLEFIQSNPGYNPAKYISPFTISEIIIRIIRSDMNGKIIPAVTLKSKIKYFIGDIRKYIFWISNI